MHTTRRFRLSVPLLLGVFLGLGAGPDLARADAPDKLFDEAMASFGRSEFTASQALLEQFVKIPDLNEDEWKAGMELLGACLLFQDKEIAARAIVEKLVDRSVDYLMDPVTNHPDLVRVFYGVLDKRKILVSLVGPRTVAVLDLKDTTWGSEIQQNHIGLGLAHELIDGLAGLGAVRVVERERLEYILEEHKLQQSDIIDTRTVVPAGCLVGAQSFLMGSFRFISGDRIRIIIRLVETSTGEILKSFDDEGDIEDLIQIFERLCDEVLREFDRQATRPPTPRDRKIQSWLKYYRGVECEDRRDFSGAVERYNEALSIDPDYAEAQQRRDRLAPALAGGE